MDILKGDKIILTEVPVLDINNIVFYKNFLLVSGKNNLIINLLYELKQLGIVVLKSNWFTTPDILNIISEKADSITTTSFDKLNKNEVESASFKGRMEDIFSFGKESLKEGNLKSITGYFNCDGKRKITFNNKGKISIKAEKEYGITRGTLDSIFKLIGVENE